MVMARAMAMAVDSGDTIHRMGWDGMMEGQNPIRHLGELLVWLFAIQHLCLTLGVQDLVLQGFSQR